MESILLAHAARYPLMEPQDAVKLIYQNEFGGGHLIRDEEACLHFLRQEYESVLQTPAVPLLEEIGNGIFRVNLAALDSNGVSAEELGHIFIRSAAAHRGTMAAFREKLSILTELTCAGKMPFSADTLSEYLTQYAQAGYPAVSHSAAYRAAYHPAYRIVAASCMKDSLFQQMS